MPGPLFFVDRSLGRVRVPTLLRANGWSLLTLSEHYGTPRDETIIDVDWLALAGGRAWPVLMKDAKIKNRTAERRALMAHGVRAFCLTSGNAPSQVVAEHLIRHQDRIWAEANGDGPALFAVSHAAVREIALSD